MRPQRIRTARSRGGLHPAPSDPTAADLRARQSDRPRLRDGVSNGGYDTEEGEGRGGRKRMKEYEREHPSFPLVRDTGGGKRLGGRRWSALRGPWPDAAACAHSRAPPLRDRARASSWTQRRSPELLISQPFLPPGLTVCLSVGQCKARRLGVVFLESLPKRDVAGRSSPT